MNDKKNDKQQYRTREALRGCRRLEMNRSLVDRDCLSRDNDTWDFPTSKRHRNDRAYDSPESCCNSIRLDDEWKNELF